MNRDACCNGSASMQVLSATRFPSDDDTKNAKLDLIVAQCALAGVVHRPPQAALACKQPIDARLARIAASMGVCGSSPRVATSLSLRISSGTSQR